MIFFFINEETKPPKLFPIPKTFHKLVRKIVLELIAFMLFFFSFYNTQPHLGNKITWRCCGFEILGGQRGTLFFCLKKEAGLST